ncbi:MAG: hypothetical protein R3F50_17435 [Gammaproteobacteria bacterium]
MDANRKRAEPSLGFTCNNLYFNDIKDSIERDCDEPDGIMFDHATQFRCEMCRPIHDAMLLRRSS